MHRRFLYKFHNKIMVFVISIVGSLIGLFFTYQVIYNNIKMQNTIEQSLNISSTRFNEFINAKVNLIDKIGRTLIDDEILNDALQQGDNAKIKKRIDFFIPLLDNFTLELIDSKGNYHTASNMKNEYKINYISRKKIESSTDNSGTLFFNDKPDGLDIKYAIRGNNYLNNNFTGLVILGFSIDSKSDFIFLIKDFINADLLLIRNKSIVASSIISKDKSTKKNQTKTRITDSKTIRLNGEIYSVKYQKLITERGISDDELCFAINRKEIIGNIQISLVLTATASVVVFIIMVFFSFYISARMTTPITQLIEASASNAKGNFVKVDYNGNNEIGALSKNFNTMIEELKEIKDNLETMVEKRTNELNFSNKELSKTNKKLEFVYKKSQFELKIAQKVHDALLSEKRNNSEVIEISSMYMPIETTNTPQYDIHKISESKIGILLFNMEGQDLPTTLLSTLTQLTFRNTVKKKLSLSEIMSSVETEISSVLSESIHGISVFYGIIDTEEKKLVYTNASCKDIYIQKKAGQLCLLKPNATLIGHGNKTAFSNSVIDLEQHDRLIYLSGGIEPLYAGSNMNISPSERFENIIKKNIYNTNRDFIVDISNDVASLKLEHIHRTPVIFSADIIFIRRETITDLDVAGLKEKIEKELPLCKNYETEYVNKVFIKALTAFENGKYDKTIKELNRINGRNERCIDLFNMFNIFAHSYFKIESYDQAMSYWEEAIKYEKDSKAVINNIEITKKIIDEKKLRKLQG